MKNLVVGDIAYFKIGDIVSVDGIMISGVEAIVDESVMTGESN